MKSNIIAVIPSRPNYDEKYMNRWIKVLNNKSLNKKLKENDTIIYFYSKKPVNFKSDRVLRKRFLNLSKAQLLVTDDLRVNEKFIKKVRPIIYYRFDKINTINRKCTFGRVISEEDDLINKIVGYINMNYRVENYYKKKINAFLAS